MIEFRLVLDVHKSHWGSDGLELINKYYFLQTREAVVFRWKTCPIIMHDDLSPSEKVELKKTLTRTGAYAPTATCKHGIHPYDCTQGCDPYALPT